MANNSYVLGIGAANVDVCGKSKNTIILQDSNPGFMHVSVGGVTRNILENLSHLKVQTMLISAIGEDLYGQMIAKDCKQKQIDISNSLRINNQASSSYLAILDSNGDMKLALSDMHIIDNITANYLDGKLDVIKQAQALVFDPCLSASTLDFIVNQASKYTTLFCDPVSTAYALRLKPYLNNISVLKPNAMELGVLAEMSTNSLEEIIEACKAVIKQGVSRIYVSLGKEGCLYYDKKNTYYHYKLNPIDQMVNASGAGDSFMAGVVYGELNNCSIEETIKYALAMGSAAVMSENTINENISLEMLSKIIERG